MERVKLVSGNSAKKKNKFAYLAKNSHILTWHFHTDSLQHGLRTPNAALYRKKKSVNGECLYTSR